MNRGIDMGSGTGQVRVRIAPSPTGNCHVGTARTALYNMLFARKHGGSFILRVDDTDLKRSTKESEEGVLEGLRWLGIAWDEGPDIGGPYGPYRQMERRGTYDDTVRALLGSEKAYPCYCSPEELEAERKEALAHGLPVKYGGRCRSLTESERGEREAAGCKQVIRLCSPEKVLHFEDMLRGSQEKDMRDRGDFVIVKSDGSPVYNFATVVDEHLMEITHVFRAVEHLTNTFDQLAVYEAMGWTPPMFGHLTLMLNPDRSKISKRAGAVYIGEFRDMGYLPEALLNFLALLGWNPGTEQELFCMDELVRAFSVDTLSKSDAVFDIKKLDWFNGVYIRSMDISDLAARVVPFLEKAGYLGGGLRGHEAYVREAVAMVRDRLGRLTEAPDMLGFLFADEIALDPSLFGAKSMDKTAVITALSQVLDVLSEIQEWTHDSVEQALRATSDRLGLKVGDLLMQVRVAITGRKVTPPLFESLALLGKERSNARIVRALEVLRSS